MKKNLFCFLLGLLFINSIFAQVPQKIDYQAVVRKTDGEIASNDSVLFKFSILSGSQSGAVEYQETQNTATNLFGLVTLEIGAGTQVTGTFSGINWGNGPKYLKVEVMFQNTNNYVDLGTSELISVPYALYSNNSGSDHDSLYLNGNQLSISNGNTITLPVGTQTGMHLYGSGNQRQVAYWADSDSLAGDDNLYWDNSHKRLGLGTTNPHQQFEITGNIELPLTASDSGIIFKNGRTFIHSYGINNAFFGENAGNLVQTGMNNLGIGASSLNHLDSGYNNTAGGAFSLSMNSSGYQNTAIGVESMNNNKSGFNNVALGDQTLFSHKSGSYNTALGTWAMHEDTNGVYNVAIGRSALYESKSGIRNTVVGDDAMVKHKNGDNNTAIGASALTGDSLGIENVAVGSQAMNNNKTGSYNVAIGSNTFTQNKSGNNNVIIGYQSNVPLPGNYSNVILIGSQVFANDNNQVKLGNSNINSLYCMGAQAATTSENPNLYVSSNGQIMRSTTPIINNNLSGIGAPTEIAFWDSIHHLASDSNLYWNDTKKRLGLGTTSPRQQLEITKNIRIPKTKFGSANEKGIIYLDNDVFINTYDPQGSYKDGSIYIGRNTGNPGANNQILNIAIGDSSLSVNNTGYANISLGYACLNRNTTGFGNTALGFWSLRNNTSGNCNTSIGAMSLFYNSFSRNNTALGYSSLKYCKDSANTAVGSSALINHRSGTYNVAVGVEAFVQDTSGNYNTAIGAKSLFMSKKGDYNTAIGANADVETQGTIYNNVTVIGYGAIADSSNQVRLGNNNVTSFYCKGAYAAVTNSVPNLYVNNDGQIMRSTTPLITNSITGNGAPTQIAFWATPDTLKSDSNFFWDNNRKRLGLGTTTPRQQLEITKNIRISKTADTTKGIIYQDNEIFIHTYDLQNSILPGSIYVGRHTGKIGSQNHFLNIAIGDSTLTTNDTGSANVSIGHACLSKNTFGSENTAVGIWSLKNNTEGNYNTAVGGQSMQYNETGKHNTAIGGRSLQYNKSGKSNTAIGTIALQYNDTSQYNTAVGFSSLNLSNDYGNTAIGALSMAKHDTGKYNVAIGMEALKRDSIGNKNTAIGTTSLSFNKTGNNITAIGFGADVTDSVTTFHNVTVIGSNAKADTSDQVRLGNDSVKTFYCMGAQFATTVEKPNLYVSQNGQIKRSTSQVIGSSISGHGTATQIAFWDSPDNLKSDSNFYWDDSNKRLGIGTTRPKQQLEITKNIQIPKTTDTSRGMIYQNNDIFFHTYDPQDTSECKIKGSIYLGRHTGKIGSHNRYINIAIGDSSLTVNEYGAANVSVGQACLNRNITGFANVALGVWSLKYNTTGNYNTAIGTQSLFNNSIGINNTAVGCSSLRSSIDSGNTAVGASALELHSTGRFNVAVGIEALRSHTVGSFNTAIGAQSLHSNITGTNNTAIGCFSLQSSKDSGNTAVGFASMGNHVSGKYNVAIGLAALWQDSLGYFNTAIGAQSLQDNKTGTNNTAIGCLSLRSNKDTGNTAVGSCAMDCHRKGNYNVAIGMAALLHDSIGNNNTALGTNSLSSNKSGNFNTAVGANADVEPYGALYNNVTIIGSNTKATSSNQVRLGDNNVTSFFCKGAFVSTVDSMPNLFVSPNGQIKRSTSNISTSNIYGNGVPTQIAFWGTRDSLKCDSNLYWNNNNKRLGLGTTAPRQQLEITRNIRIPKSTDTTGLIYQGDEILFHTYDPQNSTFQGSIYIGKHTGKIGSLNLVPNIAIGDSSLSSNDSGYANVSVGHACLNKNTYGYLNTTMGLWSLKNNTTGYFNTSIGGLSLKNNTTGFYNTGIGALSLKSNITGIHNTALGFNSLYSCNDSCNTAIGSMTMANHSSGPLNVAVGMAALALDLTGARNTAIGAMSLYNQEIGSDNVGIGTYSLTSAINSIGNTALGANSLYFLKEGDYNVAIGFKALELDTFGYKNTAIGYATLSQIRSGSYNCAMGSEALRKIDTGRFNTAIGAFSLYKTMTGSGNTAVGDSSLFINTKGNYNTAIGYLADVSDTNLINSTAIGYKAIAHDSNCVQLGNDSVKIICGKVAYTTGSDIRIKKDIKNISTGLDFILKLKPVEYRLNNGDKRINYGFIAQDIEKLLGKNNAILTIDHSKERMMGLRYTDFIAPMVKAIQEQSQIIGNQQKEIDELKDQIKDLKGIVETLIKR